MYQLAKRPLYDSSTLPSLNNCKSLNLNRSIERCRPKIASLQIIGKHFSTEEQVK